MSLFDALLLDPAPFQIWIANRTDKLRGSGTAADPYHGGLDGLGVSQFDTVMLLPQVAQSNVVIHLGPGTFVTAGYAADVAGARNLQALNNVVDCAPANPLKNSRAGNATYFNVSGVPATS